MESTTRVISRFMPNRSWGCMPGLGRNGICGEVAMMMKKNSGKQEGIVCRNEKPGNKCQVHENPILIGKLEQFLGKRIFEQAKC